MRQIGPGQQGGGDGRTGERLTNYDSMGKRQGRDRPPAHGFFDDHADVREVLEIGPGRTAVLADDAVYLGLSFLLDVRVLDHGIQKCQDNARARITAALHHHAGQEVEFVGLQL